jgi:pyridoxal phosphate enzyme (YggS family)
MIRLLSAPNFTATDAMGSIAQNLSRVRGRIEHAAAKAGREAGGIKLIAVTKTVPAEGIQEAIAAGARIFGENYVQEARHKIEEIGHAGIQWHFIGHLQTNKAKYAIGLFDTIHSVDSVQLARELDRRAAREDKVVDCLIEVNLSREGSKFGVRTENALELAQTMTGLQNIALRGLMTMPPYAEDPEEARPYFIALRELKEEIARHDIPLPELSMGMSADLEVAIEEGATMVRVGRAIFGERSA